MARGSLSATLLLLVLITQVHSQFFDFFNFQPLAQSTQLFGNEYTTRRTKVKTNQEPQISWKNSTISFSFDGIERDISGENARQKKRRQPAIPSSPTLLPIFNYYTSTQKPVRKTKVNRNNATSNNNRQNTHKKDPNRQQLSSYDVDVSKNMQIGDWYDRPANNVADSEYNKPNEATTRPYNYNNNNRVIYNTNEYITKSPYYNRPGVKPVVVDNRPPITNKPVTQRPYRPETERPYRPETERPYRPETERPYRPETERPYRPETQRPYRPETVRPYRPETERPYRPETQKPYRPETERPYRPETERPYRPETQRPYRPETQRPYRPETERPYRPETERPYRPETQRPSTSKPTVKPYIVNPIPTEAGAVVFPHEDEPPEVIRGADEDYMSDTEKRRYIDMAEKMCDKYKSLNMKQLAAIPLLPSPEPVSVNVSQCAPTQVPLVVGGKVVTINEFPHMALLGWVKIDGGGYSWKCGGSLISDQHVLTAAHCSYEERDNTVITGPPRVVQLGSSLLDDPGALVVRVAAVIRHPKYKFPRSYYDLAILKLVQPVSFSEVIKPACLGVPPPVDQPVVATGWGKTEFGGDQSVELRSVSLPVWDMERCREILGTSRKMPQGALRESQLCAGDKRGGRDTCQGDSGGPAQLQDGCVWRVVAVTSLGRSCGAPNTPGLYALVQRPFVAAAVFGNLKNNQRRSNNSQPSNSNDNSQNSDNHRSYDYTTTTTQAYRSNRRTSTESYYNPQQNDYGEQNNNPRTTTTQSYYNPPENDYDRQNNHRPDDTGYNNRQNDYKNTHNNNNRRDLDTDVGYYNQQRDSNDQGSNNQPLNGYWNNNQPNNDYNRRNDDRYEPGTIWFT